jgi:hypothetical protein
MIVAKCVVALFVLAIGAGPYPVVAVAEDVELTVRGGVDRNVACSWVHGQLFIRRTLSCGALDRV